MLAGVRLVVLTSILGAHKLPFVVRDDEAAHASILAHHAVGVHIAVPFSKHTSDSRPKCVAVNDVAKPHMLAVQVSTIEDASDCLGEACQPRQRFCCVGIRILATSVISASMRDG